MKKIYQFFAAVILAAMCLWPGLPALALTQDNAWRGAVLLRAYQVNENGELVRTAELNAAMVSAGGLALAADSGLPSGDAAWRACLATSLSSRPDCRYIADVLSRDAALGLTLFQIRPAAEDVPSGFTSLRTVRNRLIRPGETFRTYAWNDDADGLFGTSIQLTGELTAAGRTYIQFLSDLDDNPGSLVVNRDGDLMALTDRGAPSRREAIDATELEEWVAAGANAQPLVSPLKARLLALSARDNELGLGNLKNEAFSLIAGADWTWEYTGEHTVRVKSTSYGFDLSLNWLPSTVAGARAGFEAARFAALGCTGAAIQVGDREAREWTCDGIRHVVIPHGAYLVSISGNAPYGAGDLYYRLKWETPVVPAEPEQNFQSLAPAFEFKLGADWAVNVLASAIRPALAFNMIASSSRLTVYVERPDEFSELGNREYWEAAGSRDPWLADLAALGPVESARNIAYDLDLSSEITNALYYENSIGTDSLPVGRAAAVKVRDNAAVVTIGLVSLGTGEADFRSLWSAVARDLDSLTFYRSTTAAPDMPAGDTAGPPPVVPSTDNAAPVPSVPFMSRSWRNGTERLSGRIILLVDRGGEAWYLSPRDRKAHFLGRPADAFRIMREQGIGISNADLAKLTVGEPSKMESAVATPARFRGNIYLAVEAHGEAWYVDPVSGRRYFLGRPADAFRVMSRLGLGATAANFEKLVN